MASTRRRFLKVVGGGAALAAIRPLGLAPAFAQSGPVKIGVLAIKTGIAAEVGEAGLRGVQFATEKINAAGGIMGRKIELIVEEETSPKDTVDRFRRLALQHRVDVISGVISTGVGLAIGGAAEELKTIWLSWDGTTQKGVEESMPKVRYSFRSVDNEAEAVGASILAAKHFKGQFKTIAGINPDYSYGRNNWEAFQAITKRYGIEARPVLDLWPALGTSDFTSHVAALQRAQPDLIFSSFWAADVSIFLRQAHAAGLLAKTKLVFPVAGIIHWTMKKAFTPEGMIVGYNTWYFDNPENSPLGREFTKWYWDKFQAYPSYEADHAYFTIVAYKAAVEKAAQAAGGKWPDKEQVIDALVEVEPESISGKRRFRKDHIMEADFFQGLSTHKNRYDFITIDPVERLRSEQIQKPSGVGLYDWINAWKV